MCVFGGGGGDGDTFKTTHLGYPTCKSFQVYVLGSRTMFHHVNGWDLSNKDDVQIEFRQIHIGNI